MLAALLAGGCGHPTTASVASEAAPLRDVEHAPVARVHDDLGTIPAEAPAHYVLIGARRPSGERVSLEIRDGLIHRIDAEVPPGVPTIDLGGRVIVPGFIDSHVHLAYHFGPDRIAAGQRRLAERGVVAGVDLAAPSSTLPAFDGRRWLGAGPMLTAPGGYPTRSWGANGYGEVVRGPGQVEDAVDALASAGASVIKVPLGHGPTLSDAALVALVERAHARGLKVAAHALGEAEVLRAADAGVDVLAHVPLEPLSHSVAERWRGRAVVSTLMAFGGRRAAVDNLRRLHRAGAVVLYGTDLGNARVEGIDGNELLGMADAGLSEAEILDAGTRGAARFWGMDTLGVLEPGRAASLLVLDGDPLRDPTVLASPARVYVDGVVVGSGGLASSSSGAIVHPVKP